MGNKKKKQMEFRYYEIPYGEPVLALLGEQWNQSYGFDRNQKLVTDLHFHNLMEIGCCYEGTGELVLEEKKYPFCGGMISVIPGKFPHTTLSPGGEVSRWEFLFLDVQKIVEELYGQDRRLSEWILSRCSRGAFCKSREEAPELYRLVVMILQEMDEKKERYQEAVRGIRNVRTKMNVPQNRRTNVYIVGRDEACCRMYEGSRRSFVNLAHASEIHVQTDKAGIGEDAVSIVVSNAVVYLPLEDLKEPVYTKKGSSRLPQAGDELLVQINREKIKGKFPSVTTKLSLHGKYAVLTMGKRQTGVSMKLSGEIRERLLSLAGQVLEEEKEPEKQADRNWGFILRTNAGEAMEESLREELLRLKNQWESMLLAAFHRTCFTCLVKQPPVYLNRLSDLYDSAADEFLTDEKDLYEAMKAYLEERQPKDLPKLSFYQDSLLPMAKLFSLDHQLEQALRERVWLDSGGYLVIQPTEALTVIDVNTGKYEGGKDREKSLLKINLEAARETARQIRLRNLSGIILVDFINMEKEESNRELLSVLDRLLKTDPVHTTLVDMTKLSLVEITRQKKEKPLLESMGRLKITE